MGQKGHGAALPHGSPARCLMPPDPDTSLVPHGSQSLVRAASTTSLIVPSIPSQSVLQHRW